MLSIDTNILLYAFAVGSKDHRAAHSFVHSVRDRDDVVISEWVLVELYNLLRNAAVFDSPLSAAQAAAVIQTYRRHPRWGVVGFPPGHSDIHETLWSHASATDFPRRRVFDARMALCLHACGVQAFATANVKDFSGFGFARVWNPLEAE